MAKPVDFEYFLLFHTTSTSTLIKITTTRAPSIPQPTPAISVYWTFLSPTGSVESTDDDVSELVALLFVVVATSHVTVVSFEVASGVTIGDILGIVVELCILEISIETVDGVASICVVAVEMVVAGAMISMGYGTAAQQLNAYISMQ